MLLGLKNQNEPVSAVMPVACPAPLLPSEVIHCVWTLNRPPLKQSVVASAVQPAADSVAMTALARLTADSGTSTSPTPGAVEQAAKALVSWIGAKAVPCGLT